MDVLIHYLKILILLIIIFYIQSLFIKSSISNILDDKLKEFDANKKEKP